LEHFNSVSILGQCLCLHSRVLLLRYTYIHIYTLGPYWSILFSPPFASARTLSHAPRDHMRHTQTGKQTNYRIHHHPHCLLHCFFGLRTALRAPHPAPPAPASIPRAQLAPPHRTLSSFLPQPRRCPHHPCQHVPLFCCCIISLTWVRVSTSQCSLHGLAAVCMAYMADSMAVPPHDAVSVARSRLTLMYSRMAYHTRDPHMHVLANTRRRLTARMRTSSLSGRERPQEEHQRKRYGPRSQERGRGTAPAADAVLLERSSCKQLQAMQGRVKRTVDAPEGAVQDTNVPSLHCGWSIRPATSDRCMRIAPPAAALLSVASGLGGCLSPSG